MTDTTHASATARYANLKTPVRVTFDRIGRTGNPACVHPPLDVESTDPDVIAQTVREYAWPYLTSDDVEVAVDMDALAGTIHAGFQVAGRFAIEHTSPEVWL